MQIEMPKALELNHCTQDHVIVFEEIGNCKVQSYNLDVVVCNSRSYKITNLTLAT